MAPLSLCFKLTTVDRLKTRVASNRKVRLKLRKARWTLSPCWCVNLESRNTAPDSKVAVNSELAYHRVVRVDSGIFEIKAK